MALEKPMSPYGLALRDYFSGNRNVSMKICRDDGFNAELPAWFFFREEEKFSTIERIALELCKGKVLDVGAGSGIHSLYLQRKGQEVWAIDIDSEAVSILRQRGIKNVIHSDIFEFNGRDFGTLLLLDHGVGIAGTVEGFRHFLKLAYNLTHRDGIILLDSLDVRCTEDPMNLAYHEANKKNNRYIGEIMMHIEYNGVSGKPFSWLHLIPETLIIESNNAGWSCEIVHREPSGDYLARLAKN